MEKLHESGRSHVRWVVLLLLCLMYLITYLDRVSLANTATLISKEFGFSKVTMGIIFSAFIWSYAFFQVPGGWLGDRFGPRRVLSTIMAYRTVIAVLTTLSTGFYSLWGIRFLLGVGEAGAFPTATRAMQMWYPRDERGFVQGVSHAASRFGAAIGPPIAVAIMIHYGWRSVFYVIGILSLMWSTLYMLVYRNMPEENAKVSRAELARIRRKRRDQESKRCQAAQSSLEHSP
jgi:MFS family permease